jgi:hypothetical protein
VSRANNDTVFGGKARKSGTSSEPDKPELKQILCEKDDATAACHSSDILNTR